MGCRKVLFLGLCVGLILNAATATSPQPDLAPVTLAGLSGDLAALQVLRQSAPTAARRALASGAVEALRNRDTAAEADLRKLTGRNSSAEVRAMAELLLSGIYMRQGRFGAVYTSMAEAKKLNTVPFSPGMQQSMEIARVLRRVPVMAMEKQASGFLGLLRGPLGLIWAKVWVGDRVAAAVMDSGTGFSVMTESEARRVNLSMLPDEIRVASDTNSAVICHLGMMDKLSLGEAVVRHVPFLVMPDAALKFKKNYTVPMVIGSSVFLKFDQIAFLHWDKHEWFYYGKTWDRDDISPNMMLSGLQPYALLSAREFDVPLRLFIDSGAAHSHINVGALSGNPDLLQASSKQKLQWGSAGGVKADPDGRKLEKLNLMVGGKPFVLKNLAVRSVTVSGREGVLGQDLLRQGWGFALDFRHMHFALITEHSAPVLKDKIFRRFYVDLKLKEMQIRSDGGLQPNLPTTGFPAADQSSQSHASSPNGH